ncbi:DUF2183 domain-containing protein [Nocardioides anomalus]|uniref:DUF2183 domain-containing protein n=1 Tax=Nocardioides anomalus TaxID=2712223 RepID=A0A6G6W9P8_9ACTN|nr:phosphatase domain-containing protein [Nocardioides anomalus]QIG41929.1 DUF2183 domain-containing protein [Nocardioides anomalus]
MSRFAVALEHAWEAARRGRGGVPTDFRIEAYLGHGGPARVVVRGRVLDDPPLSEAVEGEGVGAALRRTLRGFLTDELPGVPLRVEVGGASAEVVSDAEGYFVARLAAVDLTAPWTDGTVTLAAAYRGLESAPPAPVRVRVPAPGARFGVVSDIDDTVLQTGVQRAGLMLRQTLTGSALTRTPFPGAAALYRDLADDDTNPFFYVSSSPWNLHAFLVAFLEHRGFPLGPVLLRDLLGAGGGREPKHGRIREALTTHPDLPFVLIGDSGERDPQVYADVVREFPDRILAVYIREVRLDPGDGRVEAVTDALDHDVPFVLAADSDAVRRHAESIGLLRARG